MVVSGCLFFLFVFADFLIQGNIHDSFKKYYTKIYITDQYKLTLTFTFTYTYLLMQFLNLSTTTPKLPNKPQDPLTPSSQKYKQQQTLHRLTSIQKQLNTLCCQHDSLMPLLELNNLQSVCYRWENSLKSINKKLGDYQMYVMSIGVEDMRNCGVQQREVENGKMITLNKIKDNIEEIRVKVEESSVNSSPGLSQFNPQSKLIQSLYQPLNNNQQSQSFNNFAPNPLTQLQQQSAISLQELKKYINISLALFKNQLLLSQFSQTHEPPMDTSTTSQKQKQPVQYEQEAIQKFTQNIFSGLKKQIEYLRSNLGVEDIRDFHKKTMDRISCDIVEVEDMLDIFFYEEEQPMEKQIWGKQLGVIEEKIKIIGWQIKGMRKKYFFEINRMYSVEKDTFEVNIFEKMVEKDLQLLQNAFKQLRSKFLEIIGLTN